MSLDRNFDKEKWFETWSFKLSGDGTLGSSEEVLLKSILDLNDIFFTSQKDGGLSKPIVKRSGITKLIRHFGFFEISSKIKALPHLSGNGNVYFATTTLSDPTKNISFSGDGEASLDNLEPGISADYPIALATKRARSRAVLNYLGIDAYGEDESPDFKEVTKEDVQKYVSSDLETVIKNHGDLIAKKVLASQFRNMVSSMNPPMDADSAKTFVFRTLYGKLPNTEDKQSIKLGELTLVELIKIIASLEILKKYDTDTAYSIIDKFIKE